MAVGQVFPWEVNVPGIVSNVLGAAGNFLNTGRTGYNLRGDAYASPAPSPVAAPAPEATNLPYNAPSYTNGPGFGALLNQPTKTTTGNGNPPPSGPSPDDALARALNDAYNSNNQFIDQQENTLRGQQQSILGDINSQVDTSKGVLSNNLKTTQGQIDVSQQGGEQRKQDALIAATRLYNELVQGGQQRFGGASSAGEAYQALAGRELQRNNQQTQTDFSTFMGQIAQARTKVQNDFDNSVAQLEQQRTSALNQANRDFQSKLLEISNARNQNNQWKAQSQIAALNDYRNQIFQINLATAQNNQNLTALKAQAEQGIANFQNTVGQQTQNVTNSQNTFNQNGGTTDYSTAYNISGGQQQTQNPYVGQINRRPEDDIYNV